MIIHHGSDVCYGGVARRRAGRKSILFSENRLLTRELPMDHGSGVYGSGVPQPYDDHEEEVDNDKEEEEEEVDDDKEEEVDDDNDAEEEE